MRRIGWWDRRIHVHGRQRGPQARRIAVSRSELGRLRRLVRKQQAAQAVVQRAKIILLLRRGAGPAEIAEILKCSERLVRKWRNRWEARPALEGLCDQTGRGPALTYEVATRCEVIRLACSRPADQEKKVAFGEVWTQQALADALMQETAIHMSRSTVQRILSSDGLRPHRVKYWLHSQDPEFCTKVKRICDLYLLPSKDAVVLSIDEKPMQALARKYLNHADNRGRLRKEYEYKRNGTGTLLGAFDVQTGQLYGQVVPERTGQALVDFLDQVAQQYPERQVYVVWDNLNTHYDGKDQRWTTFNARHGGRFHFYHTPIHASWVNQIEIWFSILQRRILQHGSFDSPRDLETQVGAFIRYWNRYEAHPFNWRFTGTFTKKPGMERRESRTALRLAA